MSKPPKQSIEDAEIVSETDGAQSDGASSVEARPDEDVTASAQDRGASEAEALPDAQAGSGGAGVPVVPAAAPVAAAPPPERERRGDSVPLLMALLGGALAAGLGWLVASYTDGGEDLEAAIEAAMTERDAEIAELRGSLERVGAIETRLSELPEPASDRGPEIDTLAERLAAIEAAGPQPGPDLTPIEQALVAAAQADEALAARLDEIAAAMPQGPEAVIERVDGLEARIDGLSVGEITEGMEPEAISSLREGMQATDERVSGLAAEVEAAREALAALPDDPAERIETLASEMEALAGDVEALRAELAAVDEGLGARVDEAATGLRADLEALQGEITAREEALEIERQRLEDEARQAAARDARAAAVASVRASLDTGEGFADAAATLEEQGAALPEVLARNAEGGIPTLAALQQDFPDLARATLASAPAGGGAAGFLSRQLGVRSLEARDGNDPDAVLSRAEAALRDGELEAALAEIEALDEPLRAPLADWTERARLRAQAVSAAATLDAR